MNDRFISTETSFDTAVRRNQTLDLLKLILSVFVVLIHAEVELGWTKPFVWSSIPLFFLMSGYFFFRKLTGVSSDHGRHICFVRFFKRNMRLYLFWFIALLPVTLYIRKWFSGSLLQGLLAFLQSFLFNSTFRGSWYIMALIIGVGIVFLMGKRLNNPILLLASLSIYLVSCLLSNYYGLIAENKTVIALYDGYLAIFKSLHNSFPAGLLWITMGKYLAEKDSFLDKRKLLTVIFLSAMLLLLEHAIITQYHLAESNHCYLTFPVFCTAIFCYARELQISVPNGQYAGKLSTILYASHTSVVSVVGFLIRRLLSVRGELLQWLIFVATMVICLTLSVLIFRLEKKKGLQWLHYAY